MNILYSKRNFKIRYFIDFIILQDPKNFNVALVRFLVFSHSRSAKVIKVCRYDKPSNSHPIAESLKCQKEKHYCQCLQVCP